jgi:hypothetical protein
MVHLLATWIGVIFPTAQTYRYHPLATTMAPRLEANAVKHETRVRRFADCGRGSPGVISR